MELKHQSAIKGESKLKEIIARPGSVVATEMGGYQHYSIVSDGVCQLGNYRLISATQRHGTVKEESWDEVVKGRETYVADFDTHLSIAEVISRARGQIDKWKYSVTDRNCEDFIYESLGLKGSSRQVIAGAGGAIAGAILIDKLCENPAVLKYLAGSVLVAGIAISLVKAKKKIA